MEYKKFEPYINGKKIGTINVNWNTCLKKYASGVLVAFMTISSLSGCSFGKNVQVQEEIVETKLEFDNLEDELYEKEYFVNAVLQELHEDGNQPLINQIMEIYKEMKNIEYDIDPINEYSAFYTEEEKLEKKYQIKSCLTTMINMIESKMFYTFGVDFISPKKVK